MVPHRHGETSDRETDFRFEICDLDLVGNDTHHAILGLKKFRDLSTTGVWSAGAMGNPRIVKRTSDVESATSI